jgi:hypothetical protein
MFLELLKRSSPEVGSSLHTNFFNLQAREPLNFPRFSREACGIAPKPMREHWLIRDKHEAVRIRRFSCNAV